MKYLSLLMICTIILFGCAKENDPAEAVTPSSNSLEIADTIELVGNPVDIAISDDLIIVAEDLTGFSLHNRNDGSFIGRYTDIDGSEAYNIELVGQVADSNEYYAFKGDSLAVFDLENPENMIISKPFFEIDEYAKQIDFTLNDIHDSWVEELYDVEFKYQYATNHEIITKYYDKDEPLEIGSYTFSFGISRIESFYREENRYYVACNQIGVLIFERDVLEGGSITTDNALCYIDTPGEAFEVLKKDDIIYVADRHLGLQVFDISDLNNPESLSDVSYDISYGYITDIDIEGNYLAACAGGGGVLLFDITESNKPVLVGSLSSSEAGYVNKVEIKDGKLYVCSRDLGILIINL